MRVYWSKLHVSFECKIANGRNLMQIRKHSFPPICNDHQHHHKQNYEQYHDQWWWSDVNCNLSDFLLYLLARENIWMEYLAIAVICCDFWEKYLNCGICPLGGELVQDQYLQINSPCQLLLEFKFVLKWYPLFKSFFKTAK